MKPPAATRASKGHGLDQLGELHRRWREERAKAAQVAAQKAVDPSRQVAAEALFRDAVGPVWPLKVARRAQHALARPQPEPRQRALDEQQALQEAWSDELDTDRLLDTDETLSFRRPGIGPDVVRRLRRGVWSIQAVCDLHGLRRDEARESLAGFLRDSVRQGLRCVRVVHGKGNGSPGRAPVLRSRVRAWLVQKDEVIAFTQARAADGGTGALVVLLKPTRSQIAR